MVVAARTAGRPPGDILRSREHRRPPHLQRAREPAPRGGPHPRGGRRARPAAPHADRRRRFARRHRRARRRAGARGTPTSRSFIAPARRVSARPTSPASGARSRWAPSSSSRWTPTSLTTPATCRISCASSSRAPTSSWARATSRAAASRTGACTRKVISRGGCLYAQVDPRAPVPRPHGRLQVLPPRGARDHRPRRDRHQGLRLPDRDDVPRPQTGLRVVELPIIFVDRKVGESKMTNDIVVEAMKNVWKLRFARRRVRAREAAARRTPGVPARAARRHLRRRAARRRQGCERILAIDVGPGTADILLTTPGEPLENSVKLVVPSRTQVVAREIRRGDEPRVDRRLHRARHGRRASGAAMKRHLAAGLRFVATESAALTFADDVERRARPRRRGVADGEARPRRRRAAAPSRSALRRRRRRRPAATCWRCSASSRASSRLHRRAGPRLQPHGSNRVVRFALWEQAVAERRPLRDALLGRRRIPAELTRLRAAAALAAELPTRPSWPPTPAPPRSTAPARASGRRRARERRQRPHDLRRRPRRPSRGRLRAPHAALDGAGLATTAALPRRRADNDEVREAGGHGAVLAADARRSRRGPRRPALLVTGPRTSPAA